MKKVLFFLASVLMLASCENFYINQNLGGSDYNPTDIRTVDYTLTDADYKNIVSNKDNIAIAEATLVADSLGVVDSTEYKAFLQIATDLAFNKVAVADVYVPAFLAKSFPQFSKGSMFNITYKTSEGAPAYLSTFAATSKYTLSTEDYDAIWGEGKTGTYYLTPATMMQLTSVLPAEAEEGAIWAVVYDYKDTEPVFGKVEEEEFVPGGDPNFFLGTPESRGYYTPTEVIAAYKSGDLGEGDSIKVGGIINKWYKKSSRFDEFLNVSYYIKDNNDSVFEMYNSYSVNRDSFPIYDFVDEYNATCVDASGREFNLGDTVIGFGALTYYKNYNVYEFKSGCYLLEHRPLKTKANAAPKKAAAAANGKKTALYQYSNGRWAAYEHETVTVVALPEDVYSAVGYTYLLDKNKNILTTFLAQEYPYAQAGQAYTVVYVATKEGAYNAIEFVYDGSAFVENLGISIVTTAFSLTDVWGSTIYYKQYIMGEGQGKLTIQEEFSEPLTRVWYYSGSYGMCASGFVNNESHPCEGWLITPEIDLSRAKTPEFSFDHAFNKAEGDFLNECSVLVTTSYTGNVKDEANNWVQLEWNTLEDGTLDVPAGVSWTFQPTGKLDMSQFVGEKIHIAFRYHITEKKSGTWEIRNLLLCEPEN